MREVSPVLILPYTDQLRSAADAHTGCASTRRATAERSGKGLPYVAHQTAGGMVLAAIMTWALVKMPSFAWYLASSVIVLEMRSATLGLSVVRVRVTWYPGFRPLVSPLVAPEYVRIPNVFTSALNTCPNTRIYLLPPANFTCRPMSLISTLHCITPTVKAKAVPRKGQIAVRYAGTVRFTGCFKYQIIIDIFSRCELS